MVHKSIVTESNAKYHCLFSGAAIPLLTAKALNKLIGHQRLCCICTRFDILSTVLIKLFIYYGMYYFHKPNAPHCYKTFTWLWQNLWTLSEKQRFNISWEKPYFNTHENIQVTKEFTATTNYSFLLLLWSGIPIAHQGNKLYIQNTPNKISKSH